MKKNSKIKHIASVLVFILLFQYISIIVPFFKVKASEYKVATDEKNLQWGYLEDNGKATYVTLSYNTGLTSFSADGFTIPETLDGYPVTSISELTIYFNFKDTLKNNLKEIVIPSTIETIGGNAFNGFSALKTVTFKNDSNITELGNGAFRDCKSLNITKLPSSVTKMGMYLFKNCTSITQFNIGENITEIGDGIFAGCTSLTTINVDGNNEDYTVEDGVLFNKDKTKLIAYPAGKDEESYTIPDSVTSIGAGAFGGCQKLQTITLSDKITTIEDSTFENCTSLQEIKNWNNVTEIKTNAFSGCTSLSTITIPSNVTSIANSAFKGCTSLSTITIPSNVTSMGSNVFENCTSLNTANINATINYIQAETFKNCENLENVTLPNGITSLYSGVFENCKKLDNITIPNNVTSIGKTAFKGCSSLKNITLSSKLTTINSEAFFGCTSLTGINIPDTLKTINENAFGNTGLTSIDLKNVSTITSNPFMGCSKLESISVSQNNRNFSSIDGVLFSGSKLVIYPEGKNVSRYIISYGSTIAENAFSACTNPTRIIIPNTVQSIKDNAFRNTNNITIVCEETGPAITYAKKNNISYETIKEAKFKDENLYNEIKNNHADIVISANDDDLSIKMEDILTQIDISNKNINSLSGLENLTKLESIKAQNNHIQDVSPIDNLNLTELNLKNQTITIETLKHENELINILKKAKEDKYSNGENVEYEFTNAKIENDKLIVESDNGSASIKIKNGTLDGTVINYVAVNKDTIKFESKINGDTLNIIASKDDEEINSEDIELYYSVDGNEYQKYTGEIILTEGKHTVKVKYFEQEVLSIDVTVNVVVKAVRKNGRIYIYTNVNTENKIEYSFEGETSNFTEYTEGIENSNENKIFVKVGSDKTVKELQVQESNDMYDIETKRDMFDNSVYRENGKIIIPSSEFKTSNGSEAKMYYSFDKKSWTEFNKYSDLQIENIDANIIYIKVEKTEESSYSGASYIDISYYNIYNVSEDKYSAIEGTYTENGNSYIFGQDRTYYIDKVEDDERNRYNIMDDDIDIQQVNGGKIIGMTTVMGDTLILKEDGKVYKVGDSYNDLQVIEGAENVTQIAGSFAIINNSQIFYIFYNDTNKTYKYANYPGSINGKIAKIVPIIESVSDKSAARPYVLYTNGNAEIVGKFGGRTIIAENVIDISADEDVLYALKYDSVICKDSISEETIDISELMLKDELPIRINKEGNILTSNGNYYEMISSYGEGIGNKLKSTLPEVSIYSGSGMVKDENERIADVSRTYLLNKPTKTGLKRLGDYTYQDKDGNVYYRTKEKMYNYDTASFDTQIIESKVYKKVENNIEITKDESKLDQNKVIINVKVQDNITEITKPDGTKTQEKNISYVVTENGEYVFEFKDSNGDTSMKVVHVTTIQNRKETKVPKVTVLNRAIKLESDDKIEYSLDNENWTEYTKEIEYKEPIYARIKNNRYECSILKITLNDNGNLNVENTELRKLEGEILINSLGAEGTNLSSTVTCVNEKDKSINYKLEIENKESETSSNEEKKNAFDYISEIADKIIYSFSSTDGKYAGCYFEDNMTEITYKDMDNNSASINNFEAKVKSNSNIEYSVAVKGTRSDVSKTTFSEEDEKQKMLNGEIISYEESAFAGSDSWKEVYIKGYAYIDSDGKLESNVDAINVAKKEIEKRNKNIKYTKIVGDGLTFYILTEDGQVYLVSGADNGTWQYLLDKLSFNATYMALIESGSNVIITKLDLRDIVNIYDTSTALTKDGKMVSLIKDNESASSVVQELQKQTDKYLMSSHLGLKDGKLYNFDDIQAGTEVTAGKIVKTDEKDAGVYSNNKITLFKNPGVIKYHSLEDGESYITAVQSTNTKLPKFVDIAEFRDSYLTMLATSYIGPDFIEGSSTRHEEFFVDYSETDKYALCYAIAEDGEIWTYINGYVIDTGINLDYFGPTGNYLLSNTKWTNKNINLTPSGNTKGEIVKTIIYKGEDVIYNSNNDNNGIATVEKNGEYKIVIEDNKGRSYTTNLNVVNIDKVKPVAEVSGEIVDKTISLKLYDVEDKTGVYAKSGIDKVQFTLEKPSEATKWTDLEVEKDNEGNTVIKLQNIASNIEEKISYTKEIDKDGNVIVKLKNDLGDIGDKTIYARTIDKAGNVGDTIEIVLPNVDSGRVTVKYQDMQGNKIAEDKVLTGEIGASYRTVKIEIDTYQFVEVEGEEEGKYTKEDKVVIYKYEKVKGKVIAKYQDTEGNKIAEDKILTGKIDESYKTEKINIDGYEFIEVNGNEEGKFTEADQEVIYTYKKIEVPAPQPGEGRLIVKYQDIEGNKLKEDKITNGKVGESYKTEKVDIYKYELKEVVGNEEGKYTKEDQVVIYKYEKVRGRIIIKYIDPDGNIITEDKIITGKVDDPYKVDRIEIEGYDLIEVIGNEEGIYMIEDQVVMFKYEKIKQPVIPQTGQARIIYIILGIIIFASVSSLSYIDLSRTNKKIRK